MKATPDLVACPAGSARRRCSSPGARRRRAGDVAGFALRWDGQEHGVLSISGDTVLDDGVREVAGTGRP